MACTVRTGLKLLNLARTQQPLRNYATEDFNKFVAKLDANLDSFRTLPTAEKELDDVDVSGLDLKQLSQKFIHVVKTPHGTLTQKELKTFQILVSKQPNNANRWINTLWKRPQLLEVGAQDLLAFVDFCMVELLAKKGQSFELLLALPLGLFDRPDVYQNLVLNWFGLCTKMSIPAGQILSRNPDILSVEPVMWEERINELRDFFNVKIIGKLIKNNPSVLTQSGPALQRMLNFYIKTMHVDPSDIAKFDVLDTDMVRVKVGRVPLRQCSIISVLYS